MNKLFLIVFVWMLLAMPALAQSSLDQEDHNHIPHEIDKIILEAITLNPELTVDIYLKLIHSGKVKDKKVAKKLLEDAFYLSFQVHEKNSQKIISFEGHALTIRQTFISNSRTNHMDSLSLQTRIVSEMLNVDSVRALELFKEISPNLHLKPLSCHEFLLPDTAFFYHLVEKISDASFSKDQIKHGDRFTFLSHYIENMTSPMQISPIISLLLSIDLTHDEMLHLTEVFNRSLKGIYGDDRAFSYEMNFETVSWDIFQLYKKLKSNSLVGEELSRSYKQFLQKNLKGKRCRDNIEYETRNSKMVSEEHRNHITIKVPFYIEEASRIFHHDLPFQNEDLIPSEIETIKLPSQYFEAGKSKEAFNKIKILQNWEEVHKSHAEVKEGQRWQEEFSKTLDLITDLKETGFGETMDVFHQKCLLLRLLLLESPVTYFPERIVNEYLKLLNDKQIEREHAPEWFLEFDELRKEVHELKNKAEREKLLHIMQNTNNLAIGAYLHLENATHHGKDH